MACKCIEKCNDEMVKQGLNSAISVPLIIDWSKGRCKPPMAIVSTYKVDKSKRGKPITLVAKFCPICGKKYETEKKPNKGKEQHGK